MRAAAGTLALTLLLRSIPAAAEASTGCLPEEAGRIVAGLIRSGKLTDAMPSGWTLESANIEVWNLVLTFRDAAGSRFGVRMVATSPEDEAGKKGRWFTYQTFEESGSPVPNARTELFRLASLVDAAFETTPWIHCPEALGTVGPTPTRLSEAIPEPSGPTGGTAAPDSREASPPQRTPDGDAVPVGAGPEDPPTRPPAAEPDPRPSPAGPPPARVHPGDHPVDHHMQSRYWFVPSWLYVPLGFLEIAAVVAGVFLVVRRCRGSRGDERES